MKTATTTKPKRPSLSVRPGADDDNFAVLLQQASAPLAKVTDWLLAKRPAVTIDERYSMQAGWHRIYVLKKRRLFYLVPKPSDFRFSMILGDKALTQLARGPDAARVRALLKTARRYPEGTAFILDRQSFEPDLVIALLEAKLAN